MIPTNPQLRQFINQFFSDDDLETFCFDYFREVSDDFGGGMSKNGKAMRLIKYCDSRGVLDNLRANLEKERPHPWREAFGPKGVREKPDSPRDSRVRESQTRDPRQVFISHAKEDAAFARKLAEDLREEGWRVWIAPESIRPGEKWVEAIDRGLETSGVFVVVLTPAAVDSRWVNTETDAAIEMQHEDAITFIPLDVAECRVKRLWRQYQYISFRGSYEVGLDALLWRLDGDAPAPPARISVREREPELAKPVTDPDRRTHEKTGIELIRIPAGPFLYGDEKRDIELPEYWIGRFPVTNSQYIRFLEKNPHYNIPYVNEDWAKPYNWDEKRRSFPADKADHPVVLVSWDDSKAFSDWAGLVLPSEEEWEKAARGTDGRIWPWGNEKPTASYCNFNNNVKSTTPVGKYSPKGDSPYGCADMTGNVWEWTESWYDNTRARRVVRGGSWFNSQGFARAASRYYYLPLYRGGLVGFRVVRRPPSQAL